MLDENTAVFAAGNVVELLDLKTKEQKYLRSSSGGGIGAIAVSLFSYCSVSHYFVCKQTAVLMAHINNIAHNQ